MSLGGGTWITQNKILPGSYINFVSAKRASSTLGERGYAAMPLELNWGVEGKVFTVTAEDFKNNSLTLLGYDYTHANMKGLRDLFLNAKTLYAYRLGTGTKATCKYATAKYAGTRGNDLKIVVTAITDGANTTGYNVKTLLDNIVMDSQNVTGSSATSSDLTANDFVDWIASVSLEAETVSLTSGANATITTQSYSDFLDKIEAYSFNTLGCDSTSSDVKALFTAFCKRMRDELGVKFQCVLHKYTTADFEGVISVENNTGSELVYWVTGASAGCEINKSNTNKLYNGEYTVNTDYTQAQLEAALTAGKFIFHNVDGKTRVLEDINTLTTITNDFIETKGDDFKYNQTIRVLDQIANDIALIFNTRYLGIIPNDNSGRISLWNDIITHHKELESIRAIENFESSDVTVEAGQTKKSVVVFDKITPTNCMAQLYMQCIVA